MRHTHRLTYNNQDFLSQNRTDPITGEKIEKGHTIVVCAACKSAFFIESWEYLGNSHCEQTNTLVNLPKSQNLYLQANSKYTKELLTFGFSYAPMFVATNSGCFLTVIAFFSSVMLGAIMGATTSNGGVGFITFLVSIFISIVAIICVSLPYNTKNKSIKQIENAKTKVSIYIDYKNKNLVVSDNEYKDGELPISFEDITEFKYHIMYHPSTEIDALFCQLQIRITTQTQVRTYFATIHRDTIPEWSNFISKLPTELRIINTNFVEDYND